MAGIIIYTVGHSTRSSEQLLAIAQAAGITALVDVRTFPGSRRYPHFNRDALERSLPEAGIEYRHLPELGGRRDPAPNSANGGWRERGFRGYADHMATPEFAVGLERLERLARAQTATVMCAEALWWRCHRRLIADALTVCGWSVAHLGSGEPVRHTLTSFAVVGEGGVLTYPPSQAPLEI